MCITTKRNPAELNRNIDKFEIMLDKSPGEIIAIADEYKRMFFCNPTEENIIGVFDLEGSLKN